MKAPHRRLRGRRSLAEVHPALAAELHPKRNGGLRPDEIAPHANIRAWWRCASDPSHEWEATVHDRAGGKGCPFCSGRRATKETCLSRRAPALARDWHPTRNGELGPRDVKPGSGKCVWWRCRTCSHEWEARVISRGLRGVGCPRCASLAGRFPELAAEWHPTRNGTRSATDVRPYSKLRVWWRCPAAPDHEWRGIVEFRTTSGSGCPFCAGRKADSTNSLAARHPEIAAEWHPTRNGRLRPGAVTAGSEKRAWWRCAKNPRHVFARKVVARVEAPSCPGCRREKRKERLLSVLHPEIAKTWHPTLNGKLTPKDVTAGMPRKVWWQCPVSTGHVFEVSIVERVVRRRGCPYCAGKSVALDTSLRALRPEIAAEWHPKRNGSLTADDVTVGSARMAWWRCPRGHVYDSRVCARTSGRGCPFCSGKRVAPENSLRVKFPKLALEWHPTKNEALTPKDVTYGSQKKVWWRCPMNPHHEWETTVNSRTKPMGSKCPWCAKHGPRPKKVRKRPRGRVPLLV